MGQLLYTKSIQRALLAAIHGTASKPGQALLHPCVHNADATGGRGRRDWEGASGGCAACPVRCFHSQQSGSRSSLTDRCPRASAEKECLCLGYTALQSMLMWGQAVGVPEEAVSATVEDNCWCMCTSIGTHQPHDRQGQFSEGNHGAKVPELMLPVERLSLHNSSTTCA